MSCMARPRTVVCLGDSITRGRWSADWVGRLSRAWGGRGYRFVNAGDDGHLAWNALRRLDRVIGASPDFVTVLLGASDMNATSHPEVTRWYIRRARLPDDTAAGIVADLVIGFLMGKFEAAPEAVLPGR